MLLFVGDRRPHHSASSGYDQLARCHARAGWLSEEALEVGQVIWHRPPAGLLETPRTLGVLASTLAHCSVVWHVLYGDRSRVIPVIRAVTPWARVVVTVHQPVWFLLEIAPDAPAHLAQADLILTVGPMQCQEVRRLCADTAVRALPYAVWSSSFRPRGAVEVDGSILVVGEHLRDWRFLAEVMRRLIRWTPGAVRVAAPARDAEALRDIPGCRALPRLSEGELAQCYQRASLLLLPLVDVTACTAALEAMASGCPIVCNWLPDLAAYLGDQGSYFRTGDVDGCVRAVLELRDGTANRMARSVGLLRRATRFDWHNVRLPYTALYASLEAGQG
jgi:glycosyltransferase involved in cell wall biosynthesis